MPDSSVKQLPNFSARLWLIGVVTLVLVVLFVLYVGAMRDVQHANAARVVSLQLADELRQSADDLTRMVRAYAATGNPRFKRHYQEIIDIREGRKPRPLDYHAVYWDLVLDDDRRPRGNDSAVSLAQRMRDAGFAAAEFATLDRARINADALARIEDSAMLLMETNEGNADALRRQAVTALYDANYHETKAAVMHPIAEFGTLVNARTQAAIAEREAFADYLRIAIVVVGLLFIVQLWGARRALYRILGGKPQALHAHIAQLGKGDFSVSLAVAPEHQHSVLGWLEQTRGKLATLAAERRAALRESERLAFHDALTDLPNRRLLIDRLSAALATSRRSGHFLALLFIDLDNFKPLNDARGHDAGDALLREVARRLHACMRESDTVARFGGDEFVVLLGNLGSEETAADAGAHVAACKLLACLSAPYDIQVGGVPPFHHVCSASIGMAVANGVRNDVDTLMKRADRAMYVAKAAGRNQVATDTDA